jgi:predicted O-methyltransferase YrrM
VRTALGEKKVRKLKGYSQLLARGLPFDFYDAVYIDGSHAAVDVLEDAVLCFRLVKPGGIMIFDDYGWSLPNDQRGQPKMAIDSFLSVYEGRYELLYQAYQVFIKKLT